MELLSRSRVGGVTGVRGSVRRVPGSESGESLVPGVTRVVTNPRSETKRHSTPESKEIKSKFKVTVLGRESGE